MTTFMKAPAVRTVLGLVALLAVLTLPLWMPVYGLTTTIRAMFYGMLAMSLSFLIGQSGMTSLSQTAFFAVSGYILAILSVIHGVPFPWPMIAGVVGATLLAALFGAISVRIYGNYFLMITLALGQLTWALFTQWTSLAHGWDGVQGVRAPVIAGISLMEPRNFYWSLLIVFGLIYLLLRAVIQSPFGLALRGTRENPRRMAALGYPVYRIRLTAFVLAGFVAAVAGLPFVFFTGGISPTALGLDRTVWVLMVVILGGAGSMTGSLIGVVVALILELVIGAFTGRYLTVVGLIFLVIVLFAPRGIMGWIDSLRSRLSKQTRGGEPERAA